MKKTFLAAVIFGVCLTLVGCSSHEASPDIGQNVVSGGNHETNVVVNDPNDENDTVVYEGDINGLGFKAKAGELELYPTKDGGLPMSYLSDEKIRSIYSNGEIVNAHIDDAELKLLFESEDGIVYWTLQSVEYKGHFIDCRDMSFQLTGNQDVIAFSSGSQFIITHKWCGGILEGWIFTDSDVIPINVGDDKLVLTTARETADTAELSISFYRGDNGELRYRIFDKEFELGQVMAWGIYQNLTSRDEYFGEDGKVLIENGEIIFSPETVLSVSDYICAEKSIFPRTAIEKFDSIDEWYERMPDKPTDTLDGLLERNLERKNNLNN